MTYLKRLIFYWLFSYILALAFYYILYQTMPYHAVFGGIMRMFPYHYQHPLEFIAIPCFFYGMIVTAVASWFNKMSRMKQSILSLIVFWAAVIVSSPFGGMLYVYYDMKAGFFPYHWADILIRRGCEWGLIDGPVIVLFSIPYNLIGMMVCFFLTKFGAGRIGKIELTKGVPM